MTQHRRKIFEAALGLDFEDDGGLPIAKWRHKLPQRADIVDRIDERERNHVGMVCDEREIRTVLLGHGGEAQFALGQVDALIGGELCSSHTCVRDSHVEAIRLLSLDEASNPAIVDPDALTGADVFEYLRRRTSDRGRIEHTTDAVAFGRPAGCQFSSQDEQVARN